MRQRTKQWMILLSVTALTIGTALMIYAATRNGEAAYNPVRTTAITLVVLEEGMNSLEQNEKSLNPEWNASGTGYIANKRITIKNCDVAEENNIDAYIRVCLIPQWVSATGGTSIVTDGSCTRCTNGTVASAGQHIR